MERVKLVVTAVFSSVLLIGGVFLAANPIMVVDLFVIVLAILLLAFGSVRIFLFLLSRDHRPHTAAQTLVIGIVSIVCGVFLLTYPALIDQVVRITLLVWLFFTGGVNFLTAYSYHRNQEKKWVFTLIWGVLMMAGFFAILTTQGLWVFVLSTFIAAYCILLGLTGLMRIFLTVNQQNKKRKVIPFPFWMEAIIPKATLEWIKSSFEKNPERAGSGGVVTSHNITQNPTDIEILVHLSDLGTNALGHVDVVVDGQVFSYGNYDHDKKQIKLFGLFWDGVFAICERSGYIKFSLDNARKTIIGYQLALSCEDEQRVKENIAAFLKNCTPWKPEDPKKNGYASALERIGGRLFKVSSGKYKTYFMLNTNCALLLEEFLAGTSVPRARALGGIITPGSLLSMFENELKRQCGPVVGRTLYVSERMVKTHGQREKKTRKKLAGLKELIHREIDEANGKKRPG